MPVNLFTGKSFPVSVETVVKIVQMLISTGKVDDFIAYCKSKNPEPTVTVPADTANALKKFLDEKSVVHPMAMSITGLQEQDCQDFTCPHIHQG
jgi:hypothetical protein